MKNIYKGKFVEEVKIPGEIVQIDTKYVKSKDKTVYQFIAVDLATRYVWRELYQESPMKMLINF